MPLKSILVKQYILKIIFIFITHIDNTTIYIRNKIVLHTNKPQVYNTLGKAPLNMPMIIYILYIFYALKHISILVEKRFWSELVRHQ